MALTPGAPSCASRLKVRAGLIILLGTAGLPRANKLAHAQAAAPANSRIPRAPQHGQTAPAAPHTIDATVRAKGTGKPLAGASVRSSIGMETTVRKTDREGRARIVLFRHRIRNTLNLDIWTEGYVQQQHFFAQNDARYPKIPAQVTFELLPGEETLGGKVVDEQGRPIGGVKVDIWGYLGEEKQKEELAYHVDATTNAHGQWRCRCFRSMKFAYLYLSHPDYLSDGSTHARPHGHPLPSHAPEPDEKPMAALRDFSDVQVMTRGVEVVGEVRNQERSAIPDAEVGWLEAADRHLLHDLLQLTTTDHNGHFKFPHARPSELVLQVKASGYAPELVTVTAKESPRAVRIALKSGHTLAGRVVDSQRRPIEGAFVVVDTWRNCRAPGVYLETGADGRFQWQDAPEDPVLVSASAAGFGHVFQGEARPGEEAVLILKRSLTISGRVRDAKTKEPVDKVEVDVGAPGPRPGLFNWRFNPYVDASHGRLQADIDVEATPEFRLRLIAKGYEPFESRTFRGDEGQVEYNVELTPRNKPRVAVVAATVRRPDGKPLAGADVAIAYARNGRQRPFSPIFIRNGELYATEPAKRTKSKWWNAAEGRRYRGRFFRLIQARLQRDGTIRVDDLSPGEYRLTLTYCAKRIRGANPRPDHIAYVTKQFKIPEAQTGRADEPYDLGVLRPRQEQALKLGAPAPSFDVDTLDGRRVKLEDFRGKRVLVVFWAAWCSRCIDEIPDLKAVYNRFGKDGRLAIVTLSLDPEKDAPRKVMREEAIAWPQGFLGDWPEGGVQDAYLVEEIPAVFLVGPDGTLKARRRRRDAIESMVTEELHLPR
jgi:protocatechuate 3,4-dioxygenase beta subunit/thiol-disulfide isomerase/thioredoxin